MSTKFYYTAIDGDVLDRIVVNHYGTPEVLTDVLDANPGLADLGVVLSAGVKIYLPELQIQKPATTPVRLWS